MDEGLFRKHILHIQKQKDSKDELLLFIKERTNITLDFSEIAVSKKEVSVHTSSVKRSKLLQCNIKNLLQEKGYSLKL